MKKNWFFFLLIILLIIATVSSLKYGAIENSWQEVRDSFFYDLIQLIKRIN